MLTKYSLLFLLLSTNFLLTNSMEKDKSVTEIEKGKGKEKENTDQSHPPQHSQQSQQIIDRELPATKIINLGPKPVIEKKKRFNPSRSKKAPIIHHTVDDNSKYALMVQKFTGMPADAKKASEQLKNSHMHPNKPWGTVSGLTGLPEQIPYAQPMINFQFHQQNMQRIQPNVGMQGKISNESYGIGGSAEGSNRFADRNQGTGQLGLGKSSLNPEPIVRLHQLYGIGGGIPGSGEGSNRFTSGNQATRPGITFSDQLGKGGFNLNFGIDSSGQLSGLQQQQGIGGSSGIHRSTAVENRGTGQFLLGMGNILNSGQIAGIQKQRGIEGVNHGSAKGSNRLTGENQGNGQLGLGKGRFNLNSAESFAEIHQQQGIKGSSGIHRSAGIAEGSGSGKYSYHQFLGKGKSAGNEESNQELSGSETESDDRITQQLSHKTSETVALREAPPTGFEYDTDQLQQIFLFHKRIRENSISKKEGTSKSIPNESGKVDSQNQEEFSLPHSSQKLPWEKKSKKQ